MTQREPQAALAILAPVSCSTRQLHRCDGTGHCKGLRPYGARLRRAVARQPGEGHLPRPHRVPPGVWTKRGGSRLGPLAVVILAACVALSSCAPAPAAETPAAGQVGPATPSAAAKRPAGAVLGPSTPQSGAAAGQGAAGSATPGVLQGTAAVPTPSASLEPLVGTYSGTATAGARAEGIVTLGLAADGVAQMVTELGEGQPAMVEIGTWRGYSDGSLTVILTTRIGAGEQATPTTIVFVPQGGGLVASDYDPALFGSDGLILARTLAP
jgi:hypothetical protein